MWDSNSKQYNQSWFCRIGRIRNCFLLASCENVFALLLLLLLLLFSHLSVQVLLLLLCPDWICRLQSAFCNLCQNNKPTYYESESSTGEWIKWVHILHIMLLYSYWGPRKVCIFHRSYKNMCWLILIFLCLHNCGRLASPGFEVLCGFHYTQSAIFTRISRNLWNHYANPYKSLIMIMGQVKYVSSRRYSNTTEKSWCLKIGPNKLLAIVRCERRFSHALSIQANETNPVQDDYAYLQGLTHNRF